VDLNNHQLFTKLDPKNMLGHIEGLPDQLTNAWKIGENAGLPAWRGIHQIIIAGMGGSAISGDFLQEYVSPTCKLPLVVHRDYGLPAWAEGEETLAIISSHSGNTEETLSAFNQSISRGCKTIVITTGGKLAEKASNIGVPCFQYTYPSQPRAAVGFSFSLMLALLTRLSLIPDPTVQLTETVKEMKASQTQLHADIPVILNPAKRMAGQLIGRWVTVIGAGILAPVARRWKAQLNEISKTWGQFDFLPETDHNTLAGIENPGDLLHKMVVLFLRVPSDTSRNQTRINLTKKAFMLQGLGTDFIDAPGNNPLAHLWCCLNFGDYVAYYLAMSYEVDPTPVNTIEDFKREMIEFES
jgi:glucose/mannose-6-phosphate isomerase